MSNIRSRLPQDKMDIERAESVVSLGYPVVAPVLPELMVWLQDTNWPVSDVIIPFLATIGLPLVPLIREVFGTDDSPWKENVMRELVMSSPAIFEAVQFEVRRIAFSPNQVEEEDEVWETARQVLDHFGEGLATLDNKDISR